MSDISDNPAPHPAPASDFPTAGGKPLKVVICWNAIQGYLVACWRALVARPDIELHLLIFPNGGAGNAPFKEDLLAGLSFTLLDNRYWNDVEHVAALVSAQRPDVIVVTGWLCPAYTHLPFHPALKNARFAMGMDTGFRGDLRQKLARLKIGKFIDRMDRVFVSGERSYQFARFLKVPESRIRRAMYGYDGELFRSAIHGRRLEQTGGWPRKFLYVGRYVPHKAIDILVAGYKRYRQKSNQPWPLTCCGTGPLSDLLRGVDGMTDIGFVQPADQPAVFATHGVFVLPSRYEPWGVVVAEAAGTGLPVLCTESCGAAVEIVRSFYNGLTFATDDPQALAAALLWAEQRYDDLPAMGLGGTQLAAPFTARIWAEKWESALREVV